MLRLTDITKDYKVADSTVQALKGVSLAFRESEFVSILGPSGCGKTTLLNIIGGLDKYTSGDLAIGGRSTKEFDDADWDVYRNHRIGFVFQSYNLIPHQTVLGNVELALTIAGIDKAERAERAKKALDRVGLKDQYDKKPNQLSGGQCQRVAIARALVNEPDILLADEPTGALDTKTSEQIMDLIREIAREKLVIMVTHNPEIAEKYSTRIIRLLDGQVVSDSRPYGAEEEKQETAAAANREKPKKERAKMSFWTAFRLSAQNLLTKKARTVMTSIAGAIGIIGISLVLAISYGVRGFIGNMQNDMLSGNPIAIEEEMFDLNALMGATTRKEQQEALKKAGYVNVDSLIESLVDSAGQMLIQNDITQDYIDFVLDMPKEDVATVNLDYGLDVANNIYTDFRQVKGGEAERISLSGIRAIYTSLLEKTDFSVYSKYITMLVENFRQAPDDADYINSQYELMSGKIAAADDEIMIVISKDDELTDLLLAQLGYYSQDEFLNIVERLTASDNYDSSLDRDSFSYEELIGRSFVYYPNDSVFTPSPSPMTPFTYEENAGGFQTEGTKLKVAGILRPRENISYGCMTSGFYYSKAFAEKMIADNLTSKLAEYLAEQPGEKISSSDMKVIPFTYEYTFKGETFTDTEYVGSVNSMMGSAGLEVTLQQVGGVNRANGIHVYPLDFSHKDAVLDYLDRWNSEETITLSNGKALAAADRNTVRYSDSLSVVISMINDMIDVITYALIGFTALSLVVSCVMIAIITYVSVVERVKEIGVIRSLGGRKKDVSRLFTAETFIIGLGSGLIGIAVTYILSLIINLIVGSVSVISSIAALPWYLAVVMVCVSILLTLLSGLFPARSAAKKDPVVALRTE